MSGPSRSSGNGAAGAAVHDNGARIGPSQIDHAIRRWKLLEARSDVLLHVLTILGTKRGPLLDAGGDGLATTSASSTRLLLSSI